MSQDGWIKLPIALCKSNFWKDLTINQWNVMFVLLLSVNNNSEQMAWQGNIIVGKPGQKVMSFSEIESIYQGNLTHKKTTAILKKLAKWQFLTYEISGTEILITILDWQMYHGADTDDGEVPHDVPYKERCLL